MKKYIILNIILLILTIPAVNAQKERIEHLPNFDKRKIHFGYYLGVNNNSYKISYKPQSEQWPTYATYPNDLFVSVDASLGFNLGFVIDYRLHKNINLRFEPGLMSNAKTLTYFIDKDFYSNVFNPDDGRVYPNIENSDPVRKVSGTYMHLPLLLKFSTNRLNNIRPYVIGGVSYDYNFSSNENNGDDNYEAEFRMKKSNFMYEVGIGMEFYFYFFKFSPSIRGIFAINNELVRDNSNTYPFPSGDKKIDYPSPWTGPIDYFGTRGVFLNLTFE